MAVAWIRWQAPSVAHMIAEIVVASLAGSVVGWTLRGPRKPKEAPAPAVGSVPIAALVQGFREFTRDVECGAIPVEVEEALKALEAHATALPAASAQKKRPYISAGTEHFSDEKCLDRELKRAADDDERINVMRRWITRFSFSAQSWQVWVIEHMDTKDGRNQMRRLFDECEAP